MKKVIALITVVLMMTMGIPSFVDSTSDYVDIEMKTYGFKSYIPLRKTFEGLGYTVTWQPENRMVEIVKGNQSVYVKAEEQYVLRNGVLVNSQVMPLVIGDRLYLPLEMVAILFETYDAKTASTIRVYDDLKSFEGKLPTLKDKDEYDKLLSFYPEQTFMYDYIEESLEMDMAPAAEKTVTGSSEVSETNTQVAGVDEADIVKIDENYIYTLKDSKLQIIKTGRGNLEVVHTVEENGFWPTQLYVTEDKLILIGREQILDLKTYEENGRIMSVPIYKQEVLMVKCYDISTLEKNAPILIKSFGIEGNYLSSRLVGDYIYVVANQYTYRGGPIMPMILEDEGHQGIETTTLAYEDLAYFPGHVNNNMLYTMGIDLNNLTTEGLDVKAYLGGGDELYADKDSMYLALRANSGMWWRGWGENTDIFSFDLEKGQINFKAKGTVPGYIINQFAMDEYNGHFRIATTRWGAEDATQGNTTLNNLYILDETLTEVGSLENLAPGETIYSTRMMGDQVYMVTYRQVDPFYVIDTGNPEAPKVLGYLKIPGYSNYMHPYDEQTIIGVGMETKLVDGRVINDGVKISIFDVSDFNNPVEKDKALIGTGNSSTDVSYDHKAFLFNKEKNILAIPVSLVSPTYGRQSKDAYIFSFTEDGMLDFRGAITHTGLSGDADYYNDYNNHVSRILYHGNDLYTLSNNWLKLNDFMTLESIDLLKR